MTKQNNGWTSIRENLPEKGKDILIYIIDFFQEPVIDIAYLMTESDGTICFKGTGYYFDIKYITHWQPLPRPPKEEK